MNGTRPTSLHSRAVCLISLLVLTVWLPGCIDNESLDGSEYCGSGTTWDTALKLCIVEETVIPVYQGETSTVTMQIIHAESASNATLSHTIVIELYHLQAPYHADNLRRLAQAGMYDNVTFHRIIDDFMIQGGDFENNDGTGGYAAQWYGYCSGDAMTNAADCSSETRYTLPDEADNGLRHLPCMVSMAKTSQPNTGGSQFFIMPEDISEHTWLNGVHTVFGQVISGCEHVTTISEVETGSNDRPVVPVTIVSAIVSDE